VRPERKERGKKKGRKRNISFISAPMVPERGKKRGLNHYCDGLPFWRKRRGAAEERKERGGETELDLSTSLLGREKG